MFSPVFSIQMVTIVLDILNLKETSFFAWKKTRKEKQKITDLFFLKL